MSKKKINTAEQYIDDVLSGKILACIYVILAVERHVNDLETGIDRGLYFDRKAGSRALRWFDFLKHSKGIEFAGKPFVLSGWQAFIVWVLFGWKNADGTRRFNYAYIEVAKKNGKTTFAAAIALYMMIADGEPRAEIYTAATKKDQAKICFDEAKAMVRFSPYLQRYITAFKYNLHSDSSGSKLEALAADSEKQDGLSPYCAIIDEYHAHKTDELFNNIKSGTGNRKQPLIFTITTAGFNKEGPCYYERKTCIEILQGIKVQDNKFAIIFTLDEGDDWEDTDNWIKSNPNLGISVNKKFIQNEYKSARNNEREIVNFKTKNLNIWTDAFMIWIPDEVWQACNYGIDLERLKGKKCFGGLDLASHVDINSFTLIFDDEENERQDFIWFMWVPEEKIKDRKDQVDYDIWVREGWITATPGNVTDIDTQVEDIMQITTQYDIQMIGFDPARGYHGLIQALQKHEIPLEEFRQGFISMDEPTKAFEKLVLSKKMNHGGNPVVRWMVSNVVINQDAAGNIKADKKKSPEKIDGIVSAIMALGVKITPREEVHFEIR